MNAVSRAPAAPRRCPVAPLVEETARLPMLCSKSLLMAAFSAASPKGVEVAWAFTYVTSAGEMQASLMAADMHLWRQWSDSYQVLQVYYNLGLTFVVLAMISNSTDKIAVTKVNVETEQHDEVGNESDTQTGSKQANSLAKLSKHFILK